MTVAHHNIIFFNSFNPGLPDQGFFVSLD